MKIGNVMTEEVRTITPTATLRKAAEAMAEIDSGVLPVSNGEKLVGMITDRDIAIRGIGAGCNADNKVEDVMTHAVKYCYEDEDVDSVCDNLSGERLRRLPVVDRDKRLVGIVSLADVAANGNTHKCGEALEGITKPGGKHTQKIDAQP